MTFGTALVESLYLIESCLKIQKFHMFSYTAPIFLLKSMRSSHCQEYVAKMRRKKQKHTPPDVGNVKNINGFRYKELEACISQHLLLPNFIILIKSERVKC